MEQQSLSAKRKDAPSLSPVSVKLYYRNSGEIKTSSNEGKLG